MMEQAGVIAPLTRPENPGMNEPCGTPQDSVRTRWPDAAVAVLLGGLIVGSDSQWFADDFSGNPGEGLFNQSFPGLAAGTYDLRFMGALTASGSGRSLEIFDRTARVTVS
jgi:hypothetical protein